MSTSDILDCQECHHNKPKVFEKEPYILDDYTKTVKVKLDCLHYQEIMEMFIQKSCGGGRGPWCLIAENLEKTVKVEFDTGWGNEYTTKCEECGLVMTNIDAKIKPFNCENRSNAQKHLDDILHQIFDKGIILTLSGTYLGHW